MFVTYELQYSKMLGETKKIASLRRSAKLPKLNIQQQIDNQEIADRMNRKVTFTKNPRHLNQTLSYVQAFNTSNGQSKFRVQPQQLFFSNYDTMHIYESQLRLVNNSKNIQRIKITPLKHKEFVINSIKYPNQASGDIAPGMAVVISIRFRPPTLNDYEDELLVIAGDGVIRIPIQAQRERCEISWPKKIECGHCWVGDVIKKEIVLKNRGGDASFTLLGSEQNATSMKVGCFKISPTKLNFDRNTNEKMFVEFLPEAKGVFKEQINFKTYQGDQQQVEIQLEGGAYSAQIILEEMNGRKMLEQKINNTLHIQNSQIGKQTSSTLKIRNLAVVQVDYFWNCSANNVTIDKKEGKMKPSELLQFTISLTPQAIILQHIRMELYLYNLPQQSLAGNVVAKKINGKQAIQCLNIDLQTKPIQSDIELFPLHRRITQPIYQKCAVNESITICNNSSVARKFKIDKICEDQGLCAECSQSEGILQPKSSKQIVITFNLIKLTQSFKRVYFLASFDNCLSKIFSLEGLSTYPEIIYSQELLYYGLCKTFTMNKKKITLKNIQKTSIQVTLHNQHRFYMLDFYDFYQFEDESCYKRKFNIYNSTGKEVIQPFIIPPESQLTLDCYLTVQGQQSLNFAVQFAVTNGNTTKIQLLAQSQDVHMSMSRAQINMREIYKGNVYNSNKFLSKQLSFVNEGNHDCAFEIQAPEYEKCDIKIQPLKGIVKRDQTQRIDLIVQPIKTGDFDFVIKWKYYDDFKINPDLYIELGDSVKYNREDGSKTLIHQKQLQLMGTIKGMAMNYYLLDQSRAKKVKVKIEDGLQSVKMSNSSFQASSLKGSQRLHQNQKLVYPMLQELNFYNCQINQVRQVQIIIENDSGLTTEYEVYAENYHTLQKATETKRNTKGLIKVEEQPFSSEMGKTFIRNRALDRSQKVHLGNNKGISLLCQPASGYLHKKQTQKILITMFNDTSGRFKDNLLICVKNHQTKKIPIDIHIKGTPVALSRNQLGIDFNKEIPFMHLGTILHSNGLVKKNIKAVNNGPKEVQLKWLVYPYNKVDKDKDIFNIQIQDAAPGSGNIVELKWNALKPEIDKNSYFSIEPKQRILKGRQEATFTVLIQQIQSVGSFSNLLICQPLLRDGSKRTEMESLAVVVQTETIAPKVVMDVKHKNHINMMQRFATVHQQYQTDSKFYERLIKLKNTLNTNLTFELAVNNKDQKFSPFKVISTKTNSPATSFTSTKKNLQTSFVLTPGSILQAVVQLAANPGNTVEWPMQQKIRKEGELTLSYSNGGKQSIELVGWLYRPWVKIQMPNNEIHSTQNFEIDFGKVHIKNSRKESIYLFNPSKVDGKWSIAYIKYHQSIKYKFQQSLWTNLDYEDQTIHDEKKCWRLSLDSGVVKNRTIPIHYMPTALALPGNDDYYAETHKPIQLQIMFKPEANVLYKSKFRLTVIEGPTFDIVVKGCGSYEQQLQKK